MLSSFFNTSRHKRKPRRSSSPFVSTYNTAGPSYRRTRRDRFSHPRIDDCSTEEEDSQDDGADADEESDSQDGTEQETSPLLPIFDSTLLDSLPIYTLTHAIRILVVTRCETTLSWEQLRSPQVSQFLLKPIQQEIKTNHLNAATIYALMANCLQFNKESGANPGNSGTSKTRAMICELLAIKLLREYTTRGLIDVLSYDFDPLQGQLDVTVAPPPNDPRASWQASRRSQPKSVRISCFEIAIRAQAKRFLAHPLVVQQLEAIWNGSIVFHAAADSMHRRKPGMFHQISYGTTKPGGQQQQEAKAASSPNSAPRKMVTLYNPGDSSLFKLSRLRVPRYRNILSTMSFAVLLGLFLAVLVQRSLEITSLEIVFWFWAAGYMLDEVVGFNEQGFGLYIASFWNTFDLGILLLLFVHLCLRMYGILMVDVHKHTIANTAYDVLAADAILLFPRLFSVLDHYRYFSQLIIAFRMMAADLMAVFILIIISCSGFFVALSLSFGNDGRDNPSDVAYALLQMLMGFTPAAWDRWNEYTLLGRAILTLFLFICHFLVVTILITVLTNSFMAVVQNANEEHQFLFAVNTISNVKSDALFSYVAPLNVIQWLLAPLRYVLPFRQYIRVNRWVIKLTHFPVLFTIYTYEKIVLQPAVVDRIDVVENRGRVRKSIGPKLARLVREPSVATFRQDQALEEVFKQPFDATMRTGASGDPPKSATVVNQWMNDMGPDLVSPPQEQDPGIVDRLERRRAGKRTFSAYSRLRKDGRRTMSVASDPADMTSHFDFFSPSGRLPSAANTTPTPLDLQPQHDDADGDDEMRTNEHDEDDRMTNVTGPRMPQMPNAFLLSAPSSQRSGMHRQNSSSSFGHARLAIPPSGTNSPSKMSARGKARPHVRNVSSATMIYNPPSDSGTDAPLSRGPSNRDVTRVSALPPGIVTPRSKPASSGTDKKTPKPKLPPHMRPHLPSKEDAMFRSTPNLNNALGFQRPGKNKRRTSLEMDMVSDIGDNKALGGGYVGAIPASFATQMAFANDGLRRMQQEKKDEQEMLSRVMMARMNSLEEGFREVIHEMRESIKTNAPSRRSRSTERGSKGPVATLKERKKGKERMRSGATSAEESTRPGTAVTDDKTSPLTLAPVDSTQTAVHVGLGAPPQEVDEVKLKGQE